MNTAPESFDYDTSDSIEEEEEEEEIVNPRSDKSATSMTKARKNSVADDNSPRRKFRGSSVGGRDSIISNFSLESSLGGMHHPASKQLKFRNSYSLASEMLR